MKNISRIVRQINQVYYFVYSTTLIATLVGYFLTMNRETAPDVKSQLSINISTLIIAYLLVSIPASLAVFHRYLPKWRAIEDEFAKQKQYITGARYRLLAIGTALISSIIGHFALYAGTMNWSMIACAGIAAIALYFCKPSAKRVAIDLDIELAEEE